MARRDTARRSQLSARDALVADPVFRIAQLVALFKVALVVYVFDPTAADAFGLTKSVFSHATALVLGAGLVWLIARHGPAAVRVTPVHLAVLAVVASFALATPFALDRTIALFGTSRRYLGLDQIFDDAVLFLAFATLYGRRPDRTLAAVGLLGIGLPVCLYGLAQRAGRDIIQYLEAPGGRPIGAFGQPDTAGAFFGMLAVGAFAVAAWPWSGAPRWGRAVAVGIAVVSAALGVATGARATYVALAGGLAALGLALLVGRLALRPSFRRTIVALSVGAVVLGLGFAVVAPVFASTFGVSGESRLEIWQTATRAVAQRPLLGVGPDNFVAAYPSLHDIRSFVLTSGEFQNSTHNVFLYAATSAGLLGLVAFAGLLILTAAHGIRAASARSPDALILPVLGAYVGQGFVTITDLGLQWLPFVLAGLAAAGWPQAAGWPAAAKRAAATANLPQAITVGLAAMTLAIALSVAQFTRIEASERFGDAQALLRADRALQAVEYARRALQLDSSRAEPWALFGTALSQAGNPSAAASAFEEAARRQPWNPLYWRDLALTYIARGDVRRAVDSLRRAVAADPYDLEANDLLARMSYNAGDWQQALDAGGLAVRIDPRDVDRYEAPVRAAMQLGQWRRAEELASQAIAQKDGPHLHVLLALAYDGDGLKADSQREVDRALALDPANQEALQLRDKLRATR